MPVLQCPCGAKLKVKSEQIQRGVKCPKCGKSFRASPKQSVSQPKATPSASSPQKDADKIDDDPLGLGDVRSMESSSPLAPVDQMQPSQLPSMPANPQPHASQPSMPATTQSVPVSSGGWGSKSKQFAADAPKSQMRFGGLDLAAAIAGIGHGVIVLGHILYSVYLIAIAGNDLRSLAMSVTIGIGMVGSQPAPHLLSQSGILLSILMMFGLFINLCSLAASAGIATSGVGLFLRVAWARKVGYYASILYVICFLIYVFLAVIQLFDSPSQSTEANQILQDSGIEVDLMEDIDRKAKQAYVRSLLRSIPRWVLQLVAPVIMIILFLRSDQRD